LVLSGRRKFDKGGKQDIGGGPTGRRKGKLQRGEKKVTGAALNRRGRMKVVDYSVHPPRRENQKYQYSRIEKKMPC